MIGGLFTKVNERKKGYAYFLVSELTRHLLENGRNKCGLLTEATKIPTNKLFEAVGYKKVYDWINILKK
jgi:predicted GNAT family acetyltransferase